jgi:hypothetical protein
MHERKSWNEKIYPTYEPYPVSRDFEQQLYSKSPVSEDLPRSERQERMPKEFPLVSDPTPFDDWLPSRPIAPDRQHSLRPLHLLNSLFSDRLNFLQRALQELYDAEYERERLTQNALDDLDSEIRECEHSLSLGVLIDPDQKRHLQRRLFELKTQRRREALLNWRDLVWLRGEIRKLQREIDALRKTTKPAEDEEEKG